MLYNFSRQNLFYIIISLPSVHILNIVISSGLLILLFFLDFFDKIQTGMCKVICPDLSSRLQSIYHRRKLFSLYIFYKYFFGNFLDEFSSLLPIFHESRRGCSLVTCSRHFTVEIVEYDRTTVSLLALLTCELAFYFSLPSQLLSLKLRFLLLCDSLCLSNFIALLSVK